MTEAQPSQTARRKQAETNKARTLAQARRPLEMGEKEQMLIRFAASFCEDLGRRINLRLGRWQAP